MDDSRRQLLWHGMFLFLIGLLTGLVGPQFNNPDGHPNSPTYGHPKFPHPDLGVRLV